MNRFIFSFIFAAPLAFLSLPAATTTEAERTAAVNRLIRAERASNKNAFQMFKEGMELDNYQNDQIKKIWNYLQTKNTPLQTAQQNAIKRLQAEVAQLKAQQGAARR